MKKAKPFLPFALLLVAAQLWGQSASSSCDVVRLRGGIVLRGQLVATKDSGEVLVLRTATGEELDLAFSRVRRIRQRCAGPPPYHFCERGWYHHSRAGFLPGQLYTGETTLALQVQHSSGWMFHRLLGVGAGIGFDFFDFVNEHPPVVPLFAEVRSYLLPRYTSPFVALGAGIGFCVHQRQEDFVLEPGRWLSGPMAQALVGYRLGTRLMLNTGIRWQRTSHESQTQWWQWEGQERRQFTHWRFMLSAGFLF